MTNRLKQETSPYLRQHASNPVDWYAWGEQALAAAREQDKPILLSIGYSACHWCHVMAHESFEDAEVAALMNKHFINIKVDREERPDLDQIYQTAQAMLTGRSGGWPLTMFLTPQQQPFFGGTYFPKQSRYNLPGFAELLPRVAAFYREQRVEIARQDVALTEAFERSRNITVSADGEMDASPLATAKQELKASCDTQHGGFGSAPKFPHPAELELCLRESARVGDDSLAQMALYSLARMAQGGIYDHIGGGFFRYSVDERWEIPHFEKMLYDNAQLLPLYVDAWLITGEPMYKQVAEEIAAWVMREMQSPQGGYYATLDADSEHEEGKFYVWTQEELRQELDPAEYAVCVAHYGLDRPANFKGHWHLRVARGLPEVAGQLGYPQRECERLLAKARAKLLAKREQRVRPGRDEKVLTSWNGLMIKGMAHAARVLGRDDLLASARRAADFIHAALWRDGLLLAVNKDALSKLNAYLDDYAFLLEGLVELMQAEFQLADLTWACELAEVLLAQFSDQEHGGFYFTAHDHETLIQRPKPLHDNATPCGNAVAARVLQRLGHLLGETRYLAASERALRLLYPSANQHPAGFATLLTVLQEYLVPPCMLVLRGKDARLWLSSVSEAYRPDLLCVALKGGENDLPGVLDKPDRQGTAAWLCQGTHCLPPIHDLKQLNLDNSPHFAANCTL